MTRTFRAALVYGVGDVRVEELPWTDPGPNDVVIAVHEASICPSDLREYRGIKEMHQPVRVGHEFAGTVAAVGSHVRSCKEGDRVTAYSWLPCYRCYQCRRGKFSACYNRVSYMGAFAEYITVHETAVLPVPDHVSFGEASCTEPLASVVKADQEICHVTAGDTVVVYGLGPMGCLHVQVCRLLGAFVVGIDLQPERRRLAQKLGAVVVIDPGTDDPVTAVREFTRGRGADVVVVTVGGSAEPVCTEAALRMVGFAGTVNIYAGTYPPGTITLDPNLIHYGEIVLTGTRSYNPRTFQLALELIARGMVDVKSIRYPVVDLADIKRGMDIHGTREAMKVGVVVRRESEGGG